MGLDLPSSAPGSVHSGQEGPLEDLPRRGILRLRGLPFSCVEDDIVQFFAPRAVDEVWICRRHGRSTGQAFVVLRHDNDAKDAFTALNKKHIGQRYIEIFNASEADVEAVKALAAESKLQGYVVRLRGLPFTATATDVCQFLEPVDPPGGADAINFTFNPDGRPTGEAYVELQDEESQRAVLKKHKEVMGVRYVEVFASTRTEMLQATQQSQLYRSQASWRQRWLGAGVFGVGGVAPSGASGLLPAGIAGVGASLGMDPAAAAAAGYVAYGGAAADADQLAGSFAGMYIAGPPAGRMQQQGPAALALAGGGAPGRGGGGMRGVAPQQVLMHHSMQQSMWPGVMPGVRAAGHWQQAPDAAVAAGCWPGPYAGGVRVPMAAYPMAPMAGPMHTMAAGAMTGLPVAAPRIMVPDAAAAAAAAASGMGQLPSSVAGGGPVAATRASAYMAPEMVAATVAPLAVVSAPILM